MLPSLVCPQGCNRREYEVTLSFRTGYLELWLQLVGLTFLWWSVIISFASHFFLLLFDFLDLNRHALSNVLRFSATFFPWRLSFTIQIISKSLLVLQELFFCLETMTTFAALVGVDVISHRRALWVHRNAMVAKSRGTGKQGPTVPAGTPSF